MATSSALVSTPFEREKAKLLVTGSTDGVTASGYQLSCAGYTRTMHNPNDLVALAQVVQTGDSFITAGVSGKLELIAEQIKMLQAQARQVLEDGRRDVELNHARCNFQRRPGSTYHLYRRQAKPDADPREVNAFWSMISPAEYGGKPPHEFVGSFRLEFDMSWTPVEQIAAREQRRNIDPSIFGSAAAATAIANPKLALLGPA